MDFNSRTVEGAVRLTTKGALKALSKRPVSAGERILVTDGEMVCEAVVSEDKLTATPDEGTWHHSPS